MSRECLVETHALTATLALPVELTLRAGQENACEPAAPHARSSEARRPHSRLQNYRPT